MIPKRAHSIASVRIMFSTAARAAPEWTIPGIPLCGERVTLSTLPPPCGMKALVAAAWVISQVPWTLSSITVAKALRADRLGRAEELAAGVVDEDVEAAVALEQAVEEAVDRLLVADVERLVLERPCQPGSPARAVSASGSLAPAAADHGGAEPRQLERRRRPRPLPAPETTQTWPSSSPGLKICECELSAIGVQAYRRPLGVM